MCMIKLLMVFALRIGLVNVTIVKEARGPHLAVGTS